jgi:hypothetical protein
MVDVLDDIFGLPVTSVAVGVLEGTQCAPGADHNTLWRALQLLAVQLPYQAVILQGVG